jgi:hypothetical protein
MQFNLKIILNNVKIRESLFFTAVLLLIIFTKGGFKV